MFLTLLCVKLLPFVIVSLDCEPRHIEVDSMYYQQSLACWTPATLQIKLSKDINRRIADRYFTSTVGVGKLYLTIAGHNAIAVHNTTQSIFCLSFRIINCPCFVETSNPCGRVQVDYSLQILAVCGHLCLCPAA